MGTGCIKRNKCQKIYEIVNKLSQFYGKVTTCVFGVSRLQERHKWLNNSWITMKKALIFSLVVISALAASGCAAQGKRCDMFGNCRQQIAWDEF